MMEEEERGNVQYINFGEADNNDDQDFDYSTLFEPTNQWRCQYLEFAHLAAKISLVGIELICWLELQIISTILA